MTKTQLLSHRTILLLALCMFYIASCDVNNTSIYDDKNPDPFPTGGEPPVITSIVPDRGFEGDIITIYGSGFKPEASQNLVNIGIRTAEILEHNETQITVRVPENTNGDQRVRISVWGSEHWSNQGTFRYLDDFVLFDFNILNPVGIAVDADGNLFIASSADNAIYRIDGIDSLKTTFATANFRGPIRFAPNGDLYATTLEGVHKISPDGTVSPVLTQAGVLDFDWDPNGNMYLVLNTRIRRFDGVVNEEVGVVTRGQRIRVFEGFVYVTELTRTRVSKYEITAGGLGPNTAAFIQNTPLSALEIDHEGTLYASAYVREYIMKATTDRIDDNDYGQIPSEADQNNPFRKIDSRIATLHINKTVMYLVQDVGAGQVGKIWRIFIGEQNAPRYGPEN